MKIFVTGARGFVGKTLVTTLVRDGHQVITANRSPSLCLEGGVEEVVVGDITVIEDWTPYLQHVEVVLHLAGRAHVMDETVRDSAEEYRRNNTWPTSKLFRDSALMGVKRFVFLSSIKVNGEYTMSDERFGSAVSQVTSDPYGRSKYDAERSLVEQAKEYETEFVILRPPMIYGSGVKGNLVSLINAVNRGIPLPFANIDNLRSLISLANLVDIITVVMIHPKAANEVFIVSDGRDTSLRSLVNDIAAILNKSPKLIPIPKFILRAALRVVGRKDLVDKLMGDLRLDISKAQELLSWQPTQNMHDELTGSVKSVVER